MVIKKFENVKKMKEVDEDEEKKGKGKEKDREEKEGGASGKEVYQEAI